MKNPNRHFVALSATLVLATSAFAQAASANAAAQNAVAAANQNANAAAHQTAAAANQAARAAASGAQSAAAHSPATTGATSNAVAATTAAGASIPTTKGTINAGLANSGTPPGKSANHVDAHGTVTAPGLNKDGSMSASFRGQGTAAHLKNATTATRESAFSEVEADLAASKRALAGLQKASSGLTKDARNLYKAAVDDVRVHEKTLRQSLKDARRATGEDASAAQAKLAADYDAYVAAVAKAEAAAQASDSASLKH